MLLFTSETSPFVRKVLILAHETGLTERIDKRLAHVTPVQPDEALSSRNPLGKVPCLVLDDSRALYDSRVICEYLDRLHGGRRLFPADGPARWSALTRQALADGLMEAGVLVRYETALRPESSRSHAWVDGQKAKISQALDKLEDDPHAHSGLCDIGHIATAAALGYLDFRYAEDGWRDGRPQLSEWFVQFSERPSMQATRPI